MTVTQIRSGNNLSDVIARRVRGLKGELQLTQADLAKALGVSQSSMSDRLRGVKKFDVDELPVLARLFSTSVEYLLGITENRNPRQENLTGESVRHVGLEPTTR